MHENCVSIEEFVSEVQKLQRRISELEKKLAWYENPHTPPSMRINNYPVREKSDRPVGKPKGSPGGTKILKNPDKVLDVKMDNCRRCKKKLTEPIGYKVRRIIEAPPVQKSKIVEYRLADYGNCGCGARNIASHPQCPAKGNASASTLALVQDLRITERLSIGLSLRFLRERFGISITQGSVVSFTNRTAEFLKHKHFELVVKIRNSKCLYIDETGFYLNGKRIWMWIFTNGKDTVIAIKPSRGSNVIKNILGDNFRGVIVSDCYSAYLCYKARYQKCWAHILREARRFAQESEEGKLIYTELKKIFDRMRSFIDSNPSDDARQQENLFALKCLDALTSRHYEDPGICRLIKRLHKYRECWFTCIVVPGVEPTNNTAERGLRPHVVIRRMRGSLRSEQSVENYQILGSLMSTWDSQGLDPGKQLETELCSVFDRS